MNAIVSLHRQALPDDTRTDSQLTSLYANSANGPALLQQYPDFAQGWQQIQQQTKAALQPSLLQDFGSGVSSGTSSLASTAYGLGALGSSAVGADALKNYFAQKAQESEQSAAANQPSVPSTEDIHSGSDFAHYLFGQAGQLAPNVAEAGLTGVAGALAGGAVGESVEPAGGGIVGGALGFLGGILEKQAAKSLIKEGVIKSLDELGTAAGEKLLTEATKNIGKKYGTHIAETLNFYGQSAGSTYNTLSQNPNVDPSTAINVSLLGGLAQALPAQILPSAIVKKFFGDNASVAPYFVRLASEAYKLVPAGMAGMSLQELASIASDKYADPATRDSAFDISKWSTADRDRLVNASAVGGLAGLIGTPLAAIPKGSEPVKIPDAVKSYVGDLTDPKNQQVVQDLASMATRDIQAQPSLQDVQAKDAFTPQQKAAYAAIKEEVGNRLERGGEFPSYSDKINGLPDDSTGLKPALQRISENPSPLVQHPELDDQSTIQKLQQNEPPQEPTAPVAPSQKVAETLESPSNLNSLRSAATEALAEEPSKPVAAKPAGPVSPNPDLGTQSLASKIADKSFKLNGGFTEQALRYGASLDPSKPEQLEELKQYRDKLADEFSKIPKDMEHFGEMSQIGLKKQWMNEAIQGATGITENDIARKSLPADYKAPFPVGEAEPKFPQVPTPEHFNSLEDILKFKQQRLAEERQLYVEKIGLSPEEASRLQSLMARDADTEKFESKLTPEKRASLNRFFDESHYNKKDHPNSFEFWEHDKRFNPEELSHEDDKEHLARSLVAATQSDLEPSPTSDRFIYAAVAARKLKELGATKSDLARALDKYTTANSSSQGDKAELFKYAGEKMNRFLAGQGIDLPIGDLGGKIGGPVSETKAIEGGHKITPDSLDFNRTGVAKKTEGKVQEPVYFEIKPEDINKKPNLYYGDVHGKLVDKLKPSKFGDYGRGYYVTPNREFAKQFADGTAFDSAPKGSGKIHSVELSSEPKNVFHSDKTPLTTQELKWWSDQGYDMDEVKTHDDLIEQEGGRAYGAHDLRGQSDAWDEFLDKFGYDAVNDGDQILVRNGEVKIVPDNKSKGDYYKTLEDLLVSGARDVTGKGAYQNTRRLTAFEKDGKVYLLSTFKDSKSGEVRAFDPESKNDKKPNAPVSELIDRGYTPIASLRTSEAQKNFSQVYESRDAFEQHMGQPARDRVALERSQIAPEPSLVTQAAVAEHPFNEDDAKALFASLGHEDEAPKDPEELGNLIRQKLASDDEGRFALQQAFKWAAQVHPELSEDEQIALTLKKLYESISTGYSKGEAEFTESAVRQFGEPDKGAAGVEPKTPAQQPTPPEQKGGGRGSIPDNPTDIEFRKPVAPQKPTELLRQDVTARHAGLLNNIHRAAIDAGLNVFRISQDLSGMSGEFAKRTGAAYESASRTVAQVVADVVGREDIVTSFHEVGHDVFSRLPEDMRARALAAVDKMGDRQLGVDLSSDPRIRASNPDRLAGASLSEERLIESTALHLTDAGFDPKEARSIGQQFVRALKDLYFRAAMAIQRSLFGDQFTSPELALQYFENRVKQFLAGDFNRSSFVDMVGGGNPKESNVASWQSNGSRLFERLGLDAKSIEYQHVPDDSLAASRINNLSFRQPDQDVDERRLKVEMRTALLNHQQDIIDRAAKDPEIAKAIAGLKGVAGNIAPNDYIIRTLGLADPKAAKIEIDRALSVDKTPVDYNKSKSIEDFKGRSNVDKAAHDAYVNAQKTISKVSAVKAKALDLFQKLTEKKDAVLQDHNDLAKEHADWQGTTAKVVQTMKREVRQLFSAIAGESKKRGAIEQQLRAIDPNADLRKYGPVFKKLFTGDELHGERLFTVLDKLANDPKIDLTQPMKDIRAAMAQDPAYAKYITGTPESNALTATVVAYAKTNARQMANLELRRMANGEARQVIVDRLDTLKQEQGDHLRNISLLAKTSKLEERVRQAYRKSLMEVRSLNRRTDMARQKVTAADVILPILKEEQAKLSGKLAIGVDTTFGHGQKYAVPLSKDAPSDDLINNRDGKDSLWQIHQINLDTSDPTKLSNPDEVEGHLRQMAEFLNERESKYNEGDYDAKDAAYQGVKNAFDEIAAHKNFNLNVVPADRFMLELGVLGPGNKVQDAFGTPSARDIGRMVNRETAQLDAMRPQAERIWRRNEQLEDNLIKLMPDKWANKRDVLRDDFLNPAKKTMQSQRGLEERYVGKPEALKAAIYNRVMDALLTNDATKAVVNADREAWRKGMIELLEHQHESNAWFERQARGEGAQQVLGRQIDVGHGVKDEKLKALNPATGEAETAVRKAIPLGPYTFAQKMSEDFKGMVNGLRNSGWVNKEDTSLAASDFSKVADMIRKGQDPSELVLKYFQDPIHGDAVQNTFLRSLAQMDTESPFDGPKASDGETVQPLDIAKVNEAWDRSGGNPLHFAELLYDLHEGQDVHAEDGTPIQDKAGYVQQTLERMAEIADEADRIMTRMEPDPNDRRVSIRGMMSDFALNARQIEHLPGQWFDYHAFDQRDTFNMMKRVAAQTAFGRNCETLATAFDTLNKEVAEAQFKLQNATRDVMRSNPGLNPKGLKKALIAKLGEPEYKRLNRFNDRSKFVKDAITDLSSYHRRDNSPDGTVNTLTRVAHFMGSMMINQPSSAISLLTQLSDVNLRYGASKSVVGASLKSIGSAGKEVAASMAQAVGLQMFKGGELHDLYYSLGLQDPEMVRTLKDSWSRLEGESKFSFTLRAAHDTLGVTLNPKGESAQHVPLQPFRPFDMMGSIVDQKITEQVWQLAGQHVAQGIQYFKDHLADFRDPSFKLDADKLGLRGASKDSFLRIIGDMKRWDMDYNDMVRNSMQRGDNTPFTNAEALKLHSMAVSEIALRGSLSRSSASWYNNNLIRLAAPLIRWSFDRMVQVGGLRLNSEGKRDMQSFARGIAGLSLAAGGGLAVSALLDQYYAHLLGKQRNLRPIVNAPNPQQFAMGVMEDLSRVGTFGMFGELANSLVGLGQGGDNRVLSVDQRVLAVSSLQSIFTAADSWYNQGFNADYPHVVRPLAGAVGLGGLIQYMQLANNALGLDNAEARVTARINAQNYLRVVGRQLGMDVRVSDGGTFTPTPITPYLTRMELAAYKNSPSDFREAYQAAIQEAKSQGHDDPVQYVKSAFSSRNPLRSVFSTAPTQDEYQRLLSNMPGTGEQDVSQAVRYFNEYAASIGAKEFTGKTEKVQPLKFGLPSSPLNAFREAALGAR